MNVEIFSIYDAAAERYMDPFCAPTVQFAIRGFEEACKTEGHQFTKFPEDYALYKVGAFDADLGVITRVDAVKLAVASSFALVHGAQLDIEGKQA